MREEQKRPRYEPLFASEEIKRIGQDGKENIFTGSPDEMLALMKNRLGDTYGALVDVAGQRGEAAAKARQAETDADEARRALVRAVNAGSVSIAPEKPKGNDLSPDSRKPFTEFVEDYYAEMKIGGTTRTNKATSFRQFASVAGKKAISEIDRNDMIEFHGQIRKGAGRHGRSISYKTINKKLSDIRTFLKWCKENYNLIATNPAESFTPEVSQEERDEGEERRRSFTATELYAIFHSPLFSRCKSLNRVHSPGTVQCRDHRFWLPLVALFSGLRLGELKQLEFEDIVTFHGREALWVHRVSAHGHKKRVKNRASLRKVPIHPFLFQVGFSDYVKARKKESMDGRIFPMFRCSRLFNETLLQEVLHIKEPDTCLHSLRHNFKDALRNATSDLEARDRLCGHAVPGMSAVYGEKFVSAEQAAAIDKVEFPVDLKHLLP